MLFRRFDGIGKRPEPMPVIADGLKNTKERVDDFARRLGAVCLG